MKVEIEMKGFLIICDECSIRFVVTTEWREQKIKDHQPFYCPNGHQMIYDRREVKNAGNN